MSFVKVLSGLSVIAAGYLCVVGFGGDMTPVVGGIGWGCVAVHNLIDFVKNR